MHQKNIKYYQVHGICIHIKVYIELFIINNMVEKEEVLEYLYSLDSETRLNYDIASLVQEKFKVSIGEAERHSKSYIYSNREDQ